MKLKEKLHSAYEWVDKHNRHPLTNVWIVGSFSFYPTILENSYKNPIGVVVYISIQALVGCLLYRAEEASNRPTKSYKSLFENHSSDQL
jgi:hypothetical protein